MYKLILILLLFTTSVQAQKAEKIRIADETVAIQAPTKLTITTANDSIYRMMFRDLFGKFTKVTLAFKEDKRRGENYWEHTFTFPIKYNNDVVAFFEKINNSPTVKK